MGHKLQVENILCKSYTTWQRWHNLQMKCKITAMFEKSLTAGSLYKSKITSRSSVHVKSLEVFSRKTLQFTITGCFSFVLNGILFANFLGVQLQRLENPSSENVRNLIPHSDSCQFCWRCLKHFTLFGHKVSNWKKALMFASFCCLSSTLHTAVVTQYCCK